VTSVQSDTVTVTSLGEQLTGVIPLGPMPSLGAVVEVEARGDLLVIPLWFEGPTPPAEAVEVDVYLTRARLVAPPVDVFLDLPADGPVTFANATTNLYPVEYDGHPADGTDFIPAAPTGYELTGLRPFLVAHTEGAAPAVITDDTSGWGYNPAPVLSPFLLTNAAHPLTFDTFPAGTDPADLIVCGAGLTPPAEQYQSAVRLEDPEAVGSCHVVMSAYGWRHTFTPTP